MRIDETNAPIRSFCRTPDSARGHQTTSGHKTLIHAPPFLRRFSAFYSLLIIKDEICVHRADIEYGDIFYIIDPNKYHSTASNHQFTMVANDSPAGGTLRYNEKPVYTTSNGCPVADPGMPFCSNRTVARPDRP